jgi:exodeoxyribonuclease VII small subunit
VTHKEQDYKSMRAELEALLEAMQSEDLDVDEALAKYERGKQLITQLQEYLQTAETKIVRRKLGSE